MKNLTLILLFSLIRNISGQGFFIPTTYKGAFGSSDWTTGWTNWTPKNTSYPVGSVTVQGDITTNTTWTSDKTYFLKGYVYVKNNAVLTIQPGTIIRCDVVNATCLVITRGAKINAVGTSASPIIFTSAEVAGSRNYGDWGGILLLGRGKVNTSGGTAEPGAGINNANGDGLYGGNDDGDSSGIIHYMRIEFAGIQYQPDKEIPGLTLGAVGSRTDIDFVQISYSGNDGLYLSGGMGRAKHLVIHRGYDSDITMDMGYRGLLQFGLILRDSAKAGANGASGIEVQNDGLATSALPMTDPTISNFSVIGPLTTTTTPYSSGYRNGLHIRRNGKCAIFNSAFAGYPKGIMLDGQGSAKLMKNNEIIIENCILAGMKTKLADTSGNVSSVLPGFNFLNWYNTALFFNSTFSQPKDLKLADPYNYNNPSFILKSGSPMASGAAFTHARLNNTEVKIQQNYLQKFQVIQQKNTLVISSENPEFTQGNQLQLFDLNGRKIAFSQIHSEEYLWQLPDLSGFYILIISDRSGNIQLRKKLLF